MPLSLLHFLARRKLPVSLHGMRKVETARVLVLSGHIEALFPVAQPSLTPASPTCIVSRITPMGRRMLMTFPNPSAAARSHRRRADVKEA
jgi:hypothetical protein